MGKFIDITGQRFGRLTVIERSTPIGVSPIKWKCQCDCGKICETVAPRLKSGQTQSCGCLHKEQLAQRNSSQSTIKIGNRYGKLVVIKDLGLRKQKSRNKNERWSLCQCDCGNICEASNNQLQSGIKKSCGCLISQGEFLIEKCLQENQVYYIKQYSFKDLRTEKNGILKFDFAVFEDAKLLYLIEFDGRQHFEGMDKGVWSHGSSLEDIQYRDKLKNDYCIRNNIVLKRIPYTDMKSFTYEDIISDKYNLTPVSLEYIWRLSRTEEDKKNVPTVTDPVCAPVSPISKPVKDKTVGATTGTNK